MTCVQGYAFSLRQKCQTPDTGQRKVWGFGTSSSSQGFIMTEKARRRNVGTPSASAGLYKAGRLRVWLGKSILDGGGLDCPGRIRAVPGLRVWPRAAREEARDRPGESHRCPLARGSGEHP